MTSLLFIISSSSFMACKSCSENQIIEKGNVDTAEDQAEVFSNNWGSWLSMATLSTDAVIVSYYDKTDGGLGLATADFSTDPVSWSHEQIDGYSNEQGLDVGNRGKFSSLAVTPDDTIWIAFHDVGLHTLRYAMRGPSETEWTTGVADTGSGSSPDAGWFTSIALDASNNPVIAHYDNFKSTLRVAHWDGSAFSAEVVDSGEDVTAEDGETIDANTGQFTAIAIDDGTEYITYYDAAAGDLKLAYGTAGNYTIETIDSEGDVGQWSSLIIEDGTLHIAYHDVTNQDLKYAVGTPGNFTLSVVDDGDKVGADTEIYLNGSTLWIVYFDGKNNNIKKASLNGETWTTENLSGDQGALGFHNELTVANGSLYVGSYNYTDGVLWFEKVE
ncbi:MAG: hypothetical protein VX278_07925 [Myxococcota bacterium]|nr:hypothetical protein [Myxococcota bacterium]